MQQSCKDNVIIPKFKSISLKKVKCLEMIDEKMNKPLTSCNKHGYSQNRKPCLKLSVVMSRDISNFLDNN